MNAKADPQPRNRKAPDRSLRLSAVGFFFTEIGFSLHRSLPKLNGVDIWFTTPY